MKVGLPYAVASSLLFREMTSGDLLNKFEREVRRFTAPELPDELERDDHIFNAAVTAWSVVEWVWVEREYAFAGQFANKGAYFSYVCAKAPRYAILRDIGDVYKHRRMTLRDPSEFECIASTTVSHISIGDGGFSGTGNVYNESGFRVAHKIRGTSGEADFLQVFGEVRSFWREHDRWLKRTAA